MVDGKNGLCSTIQLIILIFLIFYILKNQYLYNKPINFFTDELVFTYLYIVYLSIFLLFNLNGKIFLGDSGAYLGSLIIIYLILKTYSNNNMILKCEQIFFLFILPGIDMLRVFIYRILKKKNPFQGDSEHFHHLLESKINSHKIITLIIGLSLIIPNLVIIIFGNDMLMFLIIYLSIYFFIVNYLYKIKNSKA